MKWFHNVVVSGDGYGDVKILRAVPRDGDPWGVLAGLKDTPWASLIPEVDGKAYSHAVHGYLYPLMQEIGENPQYRVRKVGEAASYCRYHQDKSCLARQAVCRLGEKTPFCYEAPFDLPDVLDALNAVAQAWRDGVYVIVVVGDQFIL